MKTMNLLKTGAAVVMMMVAVNSVQAQALVTDAEADTISLGSTAEYAVDLYYNDIQNLPAIYNPSGIIWSLSGAYTPAANIRQNDGTTALTTLMNGAYTGHNEPAGVFDQKNITVIGLGLTGGTPEVLQAIERSRPLAGTGCVGAATTIDIEVVPMPTIVDYGVDSGGCAIPATLNVPVYYSGNGKYDVRLNIAAYTLADVATGTPQDEDIIDLKDSRIFDEVNQLYYTPIAGATLTTALGGPLPVGGCYFVITATNLQDRFSKKTLNYAFNTTNVANGNPDAATSYRFYYYETPTTQPIQHIENMW